MDDLHRWFLAAHLLGVTLLGSGLVLTHALLRKVRRTTNVTELAYLYGTVDGVAYRWCVKPGGALLAASGLGLMRGFDWNFFAAGWLVVMWVLFAIEAADGAVFTSRHLRRLADMSAEAAADGEMTAELKTAMGRRPANALLVVDLPLFYIVVASGALRPF